MKLSFFLFCCVFSQDMLETNDSISKNQPGMRDLYDGDDKIHNKSSNEVKLT